MDEEGVCISAGSACAASAEKAVPRNKRPWNTKRKKPMEQFE